MRPTAHLKPLEQKDPPECFDDDGALYVPIDLPVRVEYDAVLEAVVTRLQEVSDLINATGGCDLKEPEEVRAEKGVEPPICWRSTWRVATSWSSGRGRWRMEMSDVKGGVSSPSTSMVR